MYFSTRFLAPLPEEADSLGLFFLECKLYQFVGLGSLRVCTFKRLLDKCFLNMFHDSRKLR